MNGVKGFRIVIEDGDGERRILIMDAPEFIWRYPVIRKLVRVTFWLFKNSPLLKEQKTKGPAEILGTEENGKNETLLLHELR